MNKFRKIREKFFKNQQYCSYCKKCLTLESSTLDHVIARRLGGSNRQDNLVLCCSECNAIKGGMSLKKWQRYLMTIVQQSKNHSHTDNSNSIH